MACYLQCRSFPGQFSDERGVEFVDHNGIGRSMFVPARHVHGEGDGSLLDVEVSTRRDGLTMVWLPAQMLESAGGGNFVTVRDSQLVFQTETVYDV